VTDIPDPSRYQTIDGQREGDPCPRHCPGARLILASYSTKAARNIYCPDCRWQAKAYCGPSEITDSMVHGTGAEMPRLGIADLVGSEVVHETGAVRSADCTGLRPDLLSPLVLLSMSAVMAEGSRKYGDHNWLKGFKYGEILTHLYVHLWKWQLGDKSEDHLGHALWNLAALKHFELTGRSDLDDRVECPIPAEQLAQIEKLLAFKPAE
jgi:hypothetical protein